MNTKALQEAIDKAGGQVALAEKLRLGQSSISNWVTRKRIPAERVLDIERITGVSRHRLRPDLYPVEDMA